MSTFRCILPLRFVSRFNNKRRLYCIVVDTGQKTVAPAPLQQSTTAIEVEKVKEAALPVTGQANSADNGGSGPARQNRAVSMTSRRQEVPPSKRESRPDLNLPSALVSKSEVYIAEWSCLADADNELTFEKGERLVVMSRQYEHLGWLVAERTGSNSSRMVGLVPKNYVTKATQA